VTKSIKFWGDQDSQTFVQKFQNYPIRNVYKVAPKSKPLPNQKIVLNRIKAHQWD